MKSRSRQGRVERTEHANRTKAQLDRLKRHKNFAPDYAPWTSGGNPCDFLSYTHLGIEARLRFSQDTCEWTATCHHYNIKISFPDQHAQNIIGILNIWLLDHINYIQHPANDQAKRRQSSAAVQKFAIGNKIPLSVADEMMLERSS